MINDIVAAAAPIVLLALAAAGCIYALAASVLVRRFARGFERGSVHRFAEPPAVQQPADEPALTLLKPLHGAQPWLEEDLRGYCSQDYGGPVQMIFGVHDTHDPALPLVRRLMDASPERDWHLSVSALRAGWNPKVSNLVGMARAIRHDTVILSDADIVVDDRYLRSVVSVLGRPGVGLVTCLIRGLPAANAWARLGAMAIDYHFLPSVLIGLRLGIARPCLGATIALHRSTLERIGGFASVARELADDYALGERVRALGLQVAVAPFVVGHRCADRTLTDLLLHELRWARTIRSVDPAGFTGLGLTHPVPLALLACAVSGFTPLSIATLVLALACRGVLMWQVDRALGVRSVRALFGPVRDVLTLLVLAASFLGRHVVWDGRRYHADADGTIRDNP